MGVYVLVHGGWGGGWEWRQVADRLTAAGHTAYRPTLTGLGERRHLARPEVDLETHVADVLAVLEFEELEDVVLVGQSYGGAVVTGVADRAPERIGHVVYVDAFVPRDGESVNALSPPGIVASMRTLAAEHDGWLVPLPFSDDELGVPEPLLSWYAPKLVPQPLGTLDQPLALTGRGEAVPRVYVDCRPDDVAEEHWVFTRFAQQAEREGWVYHRLPVGHDAQVLAPDELAALLLRIEPADG